MSKCPAGCTCRRHAKVGTRCEPDCTCARHDPERLRATARKISESMTGRTLTAEQRAARACPPDCTCRKHALRNAGQFTPGGPGRPGPHTEETRAKLAKYAGSRSSAYKHGWAGTPTYTSWASMHGRCNDTGNARYGGRGITVCARWSDFLNFLDDMGVRPDLDHSIDRIDNDGNYEPGNCRWATRTEQAANRLDPWIARRRNAQP